MRFQLPLVLFSLSQCAFAVDPGLPMKDPLISYWQLPPNPDVSDRQSPNLPNDVDVVIIGSGITGTAVARWFCVMAVTTASDCHDQGPAVLLGRHKP